MPHLLQFPNETRVMSSPNQLFESVYERLHALATSRFRGQSAAVTLQPTALVHEAYIRLARADAAAFGDREHFFAVAAGAMRQILVDHARRRGAEKRAGGLTRVTLEGLEQATQGDPVDLLALDRIVTRIAQASPRQARIVEMLVFAGMTAPEIASVLAVSLSTVEKEWRRARAFIRAELEQSCEA